MLLRSILQQVQNIKLFMLNPGIQMHVNHRESSKSKPHHGTLGAGIFNSIINEHSFIGALHGCPFLEFIPKGISMARNRSKKTPIVLWLNINCFAVSALRTFAVGWRLFCMTGKPASVFDTFRL